MENHGLDQIVVADDVSAKMKADVCFARFVQKSLERYAYMDIDWDCAKLYKGEIMAVYTRTNGTSIGITSTRHPLATTILFPDEY